MAVKHLSKNLFEFELLSLWYFSEIRPIVRHGLFGDAKQQIRFDLEAIGKWGWDAFPADGTMSESKCDPNGQKRWR